MIKVLRAGWVLPIAAPPIQDGWIAVSDGLIVGVGPGDALPDALRGRPADTHDTTLSGVAILPGLVNAHAHLELSWMRGRIPPGDSMPSWAASLIALRRREAVDPVPAIEEALADMRADGTALVGDVANTDATFGPLSRSPLSAVVLHELIGFRVADAAVPIAAAQARVNEAPRSARVRAALVPHAPYSVSPALLQGIAAHDASAPLSIHLGESLAELTFLENGSGPWRDVLESVGAWNPDWQPPQCGPVEYLDRLGLLGPRLVAVHGVQLSGAEIDRLAGAGATIVTCPRSNAWTGAGTPPIDAFYASGGRVALGTDSLASTGSLSLFDEMAAVRRLAPGVPAGRILRSATLDGATALGFGADLGSLEAGKRAELLAVRVPEGLADVEEYLVGGVKTADITWVRSGS
jgi:cytosine/adenosine deaminase-related metal-dependent hydrolase